MPNSPIGMLKIKFLDLSKQKITIERNLKKNLEKVLSEAKFIMGPEVKELETKLQEYTKAKYCVTCASGTDALILSFNNQEIQNIMYNPWEYLR